MTAAAWLVFVWCATISGTCAVMALLRVLEETPRSRVVAGRLAWLSVVSLVPTVLSVCVASALLRA